MPFFRNSLLAQHNRKPEGRKGVRKEEKVSGPFSVVFSSPNWTIQLINPSNQQVLQTTTTDANGRYQFVNLAAGNYTVAEVQQQGWTQREVEWGQFS